MARIAHPSSYAKIHAAADRYEPVLRDRTFKGLRSLREKISINALAMALAARRMDMAMALLPEKDLREGLTNAFSGVIRECMTRGGKYGEEKIRKA